MPTLQTPKWSREPFDLRARYPHDYDDADMPSWVRPLINAHGLHPVVHKMLDKHEPTSWREVLYQWPHISMKDPTRIAYTPNEVYAKNKRVMVTSPGKYLAKHWPHVSSHLLRDITLISEPVPETMYFVRTTPEMIIGVEYGPTSCMVSTSSWCQHRFKHNNEGLALLPGYVANPLTAQEPNWNLHPFAAYRPKDGWHMALRKDEDGIIMGRALCLTFRGANMFVRSYKRAADDSDGYSHTDEKLNAWLKDRGYEFESSWPDGAFLHFEDGCAPYLDGEAQRVDRYNDDGCYQIDGSGDFVLQCTDGSVDMADDDDDDSYHCDNCGDSFHDGHYVGRYEDRHICESCFENGYVEVVGRGGNNRYWVHEDDASPILNTDSHVDTNWVPDHVVWVESQDAYMLLDDVVTLVDGDYCPVEDAVYCVDKEWRLREDCWQDDESELWYSEDEPFVEQPNGERYHQDTVDRLKTVDQPELALELL